jgi:hypothetical protein
MSGFKISNKNGTVFQLSENATYIIGIVLLFLVIGLFTH